MTVLIVHHPIGDPAGLLATRRRPRLGEYVPVGDVFAGVLLPPLCNDVGQERDPSTEDERQPGDVDRDLVGLRNHPRIRHDGHVGQLVSGLEGVDHRQHRGTTNLTGQTPEFVIGAYHQLWRIEKSFRMSKHDLQARPIYHHKRESIDAHLTTVFAALVVTHWIEHQTGWSIKKFVRTARRYRTVRIKAGSQILTAADPLPDDLSEALAKITNGREH